MDQPVLELETDKATIEVPSSVAGTVGEVRVKQGDKVKVGQVILTVADGANEGAKEGRTAGRQEGKAEEAGRQEGKAERREVNAGRPEGKAERPEVKAERPEGKAEGAAGANTAARVPDDETGFEQHVDRERRDAGGDMGAGGRRARWRRMRSRRGRR